MKNITHKIFLALVVTGIISLVMPVSQISYAEETKETQALSPKVGNKLLELQELVQNKNFQGAINGGNTMLAWTLTPYEKVQVYNFLAYSYLSAENTPAALSAYENLVAQGSAVPQGILESTLTILAQLYIQQENFTKALNAIDRLFGVVSAPGADLYQLRGMARYQAKQYRNAASDMKRAIDMVKSQGKTPKENWLLVWNSSNYESNDYRAMAESLRALIRYYPKDSYVIQLAGAYSQSGQTKKQLALMDALYEVGAKDDAESAKNLAMLNLMHEVPYRAAQILEKEMNSGKLSSDADNMKLMANAWFQARADDKAIPALSKAANLSGDADLFLRLGMTYYNVENYDKAIPALKSAINRGVKNRKAAQQTIGLCYLAQEKFEDAKREFTALGGKTGQGYLRYIKSEVERKEALKQEIEMKEIKKDGLLEGLGDLQGDG